MNDIERIYTLLLHSKGLRIRFISNELELDKYYVAEVLFSPQNSPLWYQGDDSMWYAKEGALQIEEKTEDKLTTPIIIPRKIKTGHFLQGNPSASLRSYIKQLSYYRTYTESDIKELIQRYRDGDLKAYEMLVKSQQKLVTSIAFLLRKEGFQLEDLIQEGNIGLIIAINRFDYERYNTFIVYAKAWIMQSITNYLSTTLYHVRLPLNILSQYKKTQRFIDKFIQKNEYPPSLDDIETDEDVSYEKLSLLYQLPFDLNEMTLFVEDFDDLSDDTNLPDNGVIRDSNRYEILRLVYSLSERERDILIYSFGLNRKEPKTLEEIGDLFGLTRERVRQIREKAIRRLRIFLNALKEKDTEDDSSIKLIEKRWKMLRGGQFDSLERICPKEKPLNKVPKSVDSDFKKKKPNKDINLISRKIHILFKESKSTDQSNEHIVTPENARVYLLKILRDNKQPMTLQEIHAEANNKYFKWSVRIETIEYILTKMREVMCMLDGRFKLLSVSRRTPLSENEQILAPVMHTPLINEGGDRQTLEYNRTTLLSKLVDDQIISRSQLKQCHKEKLYTIGDVERIIKRYNLTQESTRFTKYTIYIWFKIVRLLKSEAENYPL